MSALDLIAAERVRQVTAEGYTLAHDAEHTRGELARAGAVYALRAVNAGGVNPYDPMKYWPVDWYFKQDSDPVRALVKAAALIAAEIDRLTGLGREHSESDQALCLCGRDPDIPGPPITTEDGCPAHAPEVTP